MKKQSNIDLAQCYKRKYYISFYDESDENVFRTFKNIKEICAYKNKELTSNNLNLVSVELNRALKREEHVTRMLDGSLMHVYLIDIRDI